MSKYNDDEFKDIKKGIPTENSARKASVNFVILFIVVGIILALAIFLFQDLIISQGRNLYKLGLFVPVQTIINSVLAFLVGTIQAWVFKSRIKSRGYIFICFSVIGGIIAGILGGLLLNSGINQSYIVGLITGTLAGGISSALQNIIMRNERYSSKWFVYSFVSWAIIYSIGWTIGWESDNGFTMALAGGFIMMTSGISLAIFLNNTPQIEFS